MATITGTVIPSLPLCSVLIANYNGTRLIGECIESVLTQDCGFEVEIIVHDDASTDGSADFIRSHYPQVILIESPGNVGFCVSNNRMAAAARGEYLLLLNNDATLFPDALRTLRERADSLPNPAILGLPQYNAASGELIDIGSRFDLFLNPIPRTSVGNEEVGMVIGACFWLPRSLWNELGGFPEWFGSLAEDMYLCLLARLRGYPVLALPISGFRHWVGKSLGGGKVVVGRLSTKAARRTLSERNKSYVICLSYPAPFLQFLLPLHLLLLLLEGMVLAAIKRDAGLFRTIYLGCVISLWKNRQQLASKRREVQGGRVCGRAEFFAVFDWLPHKVRLLFRHGVPEIR
jgi:GT2 family glycosyltransferase